MRTFLILIFSPVFWYIIYDMLFYMVPIAMNDYSSIETEHIAFVLFCDIVSLISFVLLYVFWKKKPPPKKVKEPDVFRKANSLHWMWYAAFFVMIVLMLHYLIYHVFNTINYGMVFSQYARFYALSKRGVAWIFYIITVLFYIMFVDLYKGGADMKKIFFIVLSALILSLTGGRSLILVYLFLLVFIYVVIERKKLPVATVIGIGLLGIVIFLFNAVLRASDVETYMSGNSILLDFDNAFVLNDVIDYIETKGVPYMESLYDLAIMFIPRSAWPDKPMSTAETRLIYPFVAQYGTNYTFGIYANVLLNLGYFGWAIIPFFIVLSNYFYIYIVKTMKRNIARFVILFYAINYIQFIRGGLINYRLVISFVFLMVAMLIYLMISKRIKLKRETNSSVVNEISTND